MKNRKEEKRKTHFTNPNHTILMVILLQEVENEEEDITGLYK
jgi:hypothetical protein